jgi:hypothetical protein
MAGLSATTGRDVRAPTRLCLPASPLAALAAGAALGASVCLTFPGVARGDARAGTIGVGEIHEGMKGYGLTVFHGTEPERFDVEVIGVLHNFKPAQDLILIKTPHPRLNVVKAVAGMSGSPIFLDGRLAGAYSYALSTFASEAIAGVTPIALMLTELARPIPPGFWPPPGDGPLAAPRTSSLEGRPKGEGRETSYDGEPGSYDLGEHARLLARRMVRDDGFRTYSPVSTPLMLAGVGDRTAHMLTALLEPLGLEPLQTGGGQGPVAGAPEHFVDGAALGVEFVRGDVSAMGLGTVTHVEGRKLCAFGHPLMGAGDTALPTSIGRVLWINASEQRSFKIGESARSIGTLIQDRQSAIVVDESRRPPMFPVSIQLSGVPGAPKTSWHMEVAEDKFLSTNFVATALGSAIEATVNEKRDVTWAMHSSVKIRDHGTLEVDDFGVAVGGMPDEGDVARSRVVRAIGDVLNNPWQPARVDGIEAKFSVQFTRDLWRLRGVELLDEVVDAGHEARIRLHLVTYGGVEAVREVVVTMPHELAGKEVDVEVLPGYEVAPDVAPPENLTELIANEARQSLTPRSVVLQVRAPSQGVLFHGHVAPELPGFALDALRPAHSDTGPEAYTSYLRTVMPTERFIEGHDKVRVKVRPIMR